MSYIYSCVTVFLCKCRYKISFTNRKSGYTVNPRVVLLLPLNTSTPSSSFWLSDGLNKGYNSLNALLKTTTGNVRVGAWWDESMCLPVLLWSVFLVFLQSDSFIPVVCTSKERSVRGVLGCSSTQIFKCCLKHCGIVQTIVHGADEVP